MSKQLLIAIDPGFDSMKVIANGIHFKFPFSAVETDERKMSDYISSLLGLPTASPTSRSTWNLKTARSDSAARTSGRECIVQRSVLVQITGKGEI